MPLVSRGKNPSLVEKGLDPPSDIFNLLTASFNRTSRSLCRWGPLPSVMGPDAEIQRLNEDGDARK